MNSARELSILVLANSPESGRILSMRMSRFSGYSSGASTTGQRSWGKSDSNTQKAWQSQIGKTKLAVSPYRVSLRAYLRFTISPPPTDPPYLGKVFWGRRQSALALPHWLPSVQTVDGRAVGAAPLWQCLGSHLLGFLQDLRQRMTAGGLEVSAWWTEQLREKKTVYHVLSCVLCLKKRKKKIIRCS